MEPDDRMLQEHRAASLLLRGRSLCNYAIDGDGSRGRGAALRAIALGLMVLALANPSFTREDRDPIPSVVAVIVVLIY